MKAQYVFSALAALGLSASLGEAATVQFGSLFGYGPETFPNYVVEGDDPLAEYLATEGTYLWFMCVDFDSQDPADVGEVEFYLSFSSEILTGGPWDVINADGRRDEIVGYINNMWFHNEAAVLADLLPDDPWTSPGMAIQYASWMLIESYASGMWSGDYDDAAVDAILANWTGLGDATGTLVENYLRSAMNPASVDSRKVIFGIPLETPTDPNHSRFQSVMFFTSQPIIIPEPSAALLVGAAGVAFLSRRRRQVM